MSKDLVEALVGPRERDIGLLAGLVAQSDMARGGLCGYAKYTLRRMGVPEEDIRVRSNEMIERRRNDQG